jgi:hypothetical protein
MNNFEEWWAKKRRFAEEEEKKEKKGKKGKKGKKEG